MVSSVVLPTFKETIHLDPFFARSVMRRSASYWRSRDLMLVAVVACRLGGKERLFLQRFGTVVRRRPFHPDRGTRRRLDPVNCRQNTDPRLTTRQFLRTLCFRSGL